MFIDWHLWSVAFTLFKVCLLIITLRNKQFNKQVENLLVLASNVVVFQSDSAFYCFEEIVIYCTLC